MNTLFTRASLTTLTGLCRRTQQAYEKKAGVIVRPNYALGPRCIARGSVRCTTTPTAAALQEFSWQKGTAVFPFTDYRGKHGRPNTTYIAWQLPNSYTGPHQPCSSTSRRRLNRKLADLRKKRDAGNGQLSGAPPPTPSPPQPLYHQTAVILAKAINRRNVSQGYCPGRPFVKRKKNGRIWYWIRVE